MTHNLYKEWRSIKNCIYKWIPPTALEFVLKIEIFSKTAKANPFLKVDCGDQIRLNRDGMGFNLTITPGVTCDLGCNGEYSIPPNITCTTYGSGIVFLLVSVFLIESLMNMRYKDFKQGTLAYNHFKIWTWIILTRPNLIGPYFISLENSRSHEQ